MPCKGITIRSICKKKCPENSLFPRHSQLDYQDSNLGKQNQNLLCYHYTIVQT